MNRPGADFMDAEVVPRLALLVGMLAWAFSPFHFLLLYAVLLLARPHEFVAGLQGIPLMPAAMGGALLAWLLAREKDFGSPSPLLLLFLVLAMAFSRVAMGWLGGIPDVLTAFLPAAVLFLLVATAVTTLTRQRVFLTLLFGASVYMAVHGIQQDIAGAGWTGETTIHGRIRYLGFFNDPNDLGMFFVLTLPLAFFLWSDVANRLFRLALAAGLAVVFYGIYLTGSRGTLLATVAVLGVYFARRYGWGLAGFLGMLFLPLMMVLLPQRFTDLDPGESSAHGRVEAWYNGLQLFQGNPLTGVGWGRFTDFVDLTAHNSLVLVLAETGLVGLTFWLAFFVSVIWGLIQVVRHWGMHGDPESDPDGERWRNLARALLIAWVGIAVTTFFLSRSYNIMLYLMAAISVAVFLGYRRGRSLEPIGVTRILELSAVGALGLAAFFFVVVKVLLRGAG
ncbi:MAG: O-antigen ligase family protein [Thiohalospira sp.]|uniref:O-antigen ligase family protein n=1 Tax=Thiohalospira sp. TaxID=3080549 RepID=UPI0039806BEE